MPETKLTANAVKEIADLARKVDLEVLLPDGKTGTLIPEGYKLDVRAEKYPTPKVIDQSEQFTETLSFISYVNRFKNQDTQILADVNTGGTMPRVRAIIDYHKPPTETELPTPARCLHHAVLLAQLSEEWQTWSAIDGKDMPQRQFAEFIEENSLDIQTPDGATLLEIVTHLKAHKNVEFESSKNLQNGETQLVYREDIKGVGRKGEVIIPEKIELALPVFFKGEVVKVIAFFRFNIEGGSLTFKIKIHRKKQILSDAFDLVIDQIHADTRIEPYHGLLR